MGVETGISVFKNNYFLSGTIPNEIVVEFRPDFPKNQYGAVAAEYEFEIKKILKFAPYAVLDTKGTGFRKAVNSVNGNAVVVSAAVNSWCNAALVPNDPSYEKQWHLQKINMELAWDNSWSENGKGILVGIIDTGVAYEDFEIYRLAPDLMGTSFIQGYDFVNEDFHANDDEGHGTHVCGTVAQTTNNNEGAAGIAFNATIMPIKVLDSRGNGTADWLIDGLYLAADKGVHVVNMSLSWQNGYDPGPVVHNAVKYAYDRGVCLVGSAGNDYNAVVNYPAAYPEVISVGASDFEDMRPPYSNYGLDLEVVAPGGDLGSDKNLDGFPDGVLQQTFVGNVIDFDYFFFEGTSMAAPHVSGLAALLFASGAKGISAVRNILHSTSVDIGAAGKDLEFGYGRIDAQAALNAVLAEDMERLTNSSTVSQKCDIAAIGNTVHLIWDEGSRLYYRGNSCNGNSGCWDSPQSLTNWGEIFSGKNPFALAASGDYVYIVMSWRSSSSEYYNILFKKSNDGGLTFSPWLKLYESSGQSIQPTMIVFRGNVYIAWSDFIQGNYEVMFKRNSDYGSVSAWSQTQQITSNGGNSNLPCLAAADDYVHLAWQDTSPGNKEIYYKKNSNFGAAGFWPGTKRITYSAGDSWFPDITAIRNHVYIVWCDNSPGNYEVYYKRNIDYGGAAAWENAKRITENAGSSRKPDIAAWGTSVEIVWHDNNSGFWEIYSKTSRDSGYDFDSVQRKSYSSGYSLHPKVDIINNLIFWNDNNTGRYEIYKK